MILGIVCIATIAIVFYLLTVKVKKQQREVQAETFETEEVVDSKEDLEMKEKLALIEETLGIKEESIDEMVSRLKDIKSPDSNKPFAKMSSPTVNELPVQVESILDDTIETPIVGKKRGRKKKNS